jgi:hypothetical protein
MRILELIPFVLLSSLTAVACGGSSDPGPQPLRYTLDDMHIAQIPIEEKRTVIESQQAHSVARMQHAKAMADLEDVGTQLDVTKNERKQALLEEQSAQRKLKAAEDSADLNRVNNSKRELRAAELSRKAIDEKVSYLEELRNYYKKLVRATKEEEYHQEARYELAKAQLAKRKNIRPRDFDYAKFEEQSRDRSRLSQRWAQEAKQSLAKANEKKKRWKGLEKESERMRGGDTGANEPGTGVQL